MRLLVLATTAAAICLSGCSGGARSSSSTAAPQPSPTSDAFAAVGAAAEAAYVAQRISGMGLSIYDRTGTRVFEKMYGDFHPDREVAVASASKLVSGVVMFRLVDAGYLSLDSTTGEVLGWTDEQGAISVRHLLSFTSGLQREQPCTLNALVSLAQCVAAIAAEPYTGVPGELFDYGSTHLHVAARMAEVRTGASWNEIVQAQIGAALGVDLTYYTLPRQGSGTYNPLIAGGLRTSMNDYARILRLVFDRGAWEGMQMIEPSMFDAQSRAPFPQAAVGETPLAFADGFAHYGLTAWLECDAPDEGCGTISSPGAFGFTPWIDRDAGYYAILGMELTSAPSGVVAFAVRLKDELKPLIAQALRRS